MMQGGDFSKPKELDFWNRNLTLFFIFFLQQGSLEMFSNAQP
jgi:hypothetical protein